MALPISKAMDLAKDMKNKGISGSIAMGEPKHMGSGDAYDDAPEKDEVDPDMKSIAGEIIGYVESGDAEGLAKCLQELVERAGGSEPDGDESPSY
jgi:hypothetical protein